MQYAPLPGLGRRLTPPLIQHLAQAGRQRSFSRKKEFNVVYERLIPQGGCCGSSISCALDRQSRQRGARCSASAAATGESNSSGDEVQNSFVGALRQQAKAMDGMWGRFIPMVRFQLQII